MEKDYLDANYSYWNHVYIDENVESHVFRPYGRIFCDELNLIGPGLKILDFGCGSGSALAFFLRKGFDIYGVDSSSESIERCRNRIPDFSEHFLCIDPDPSNYSILFGGEYDLVTAIQSLYYLSNSDLQICLKNLFNNMKPGGVIYATMMGKKHWYFDHAQKISDGLYEINIHTKRIEISNYFLNFIHSKEDMVKKFSLFEKLHIGYYDSVYREDEGSNFHYTFIGRKT